MRRARKTAITLAFDTQSSRADAIPPKIVELVKLNACFAVKSWRSNDGFLGDGSFQAGIRATELRMGKGVSTSILTGATVERFEISHAGVDGFGTRDLRGQGYVTGVPNPSQTCPNPSRTARLGYVCVPVTDVPDPRSAETARCAVATDTAYRAARSFTVGIGSPSSNAPHRMAARRSAAMRW
jgi:hypothetical protein